eukprot:TRINITY_DN1168_c0_g1_i2.p1 TRINITY_DN1168_c0_g1~~TRINITY_DN1168_c0_g1_i2.p1  ORF type:complete len:130 (-),score=20.08 TRINITY_DN1168_c0_g1_i2:62-451(-)
MITLYSFFSSSFTAEEKSSPSPNSGMPSLSSSLGASVVPTSCWRAFMYSLRMSMFSIPSWGRMPGRSSLTPVIHSKNEGKTNTFSAHTEFEKPEIRSVSMGLDECYLFSNILLSSHAPVMTNILAWKLA